MLHGDPTLAAEPGFHDHAPGGVEVVAGPLRHALGILPVLFEHFTENPFTGGGMEPQSAVWIMIELTGSQATDAAQSPVIELVGD